MTGYQSYEVYAYASYFCGAVRTEPADAQLGSMRRRKCGVLEVDKLTGVEATQRFFSSRAGPVLSM